MARNRVTIAATPDEVFAVFSDPWCYPEWVVGASQVRGHDSGFPAVGTKFHHEVGMAPATLADHTEVLELDPPRRIVLEAKARPFGTARVELEVRPCGDGAEVLMVETPGDTLTRLVAGNPLADALLRLRNAKALSRLKRLIEGEPGGEGIARRDRDPSGRPVLGTIPSRG